jgi:hypothetical protein
LCISKEEYKSIEKLLDQLKKDDDRVPKDASVIDFITRVIIPNGITLTQSERDRIDLERNPRLIRTPDEFRAEQSGQYVGTRTPNVPIRRG